MKKLGLIGGVGVESTIPYCNIESIILACTELPLLFGDTQACVPLLDTMDLHIQEIIKRILED